MNTNAKWWKIALWCIACSAVVAVMAWLISYIPWVHTKAFRLGATSVALVCSVLDLIHMLLSDSLKEKPWLKAAVKVVRGVYITAWTCYGATLL